MNKALVLRTCNADMTSHGGFIWPESGLVEASDWSPIAECGKGLHGALWGEGDGSLFNWDADAKWLVVEVDESDIVDLCGKVKFRHGIVVFCGDRKSATKYIIAHGAKGAVIGATATAGDFGTATAGDFGTATAGDFGTATAGDLGTAAAGDRGVICLHYWDAKSNRRRHKTGYVGENGILPNTAYQLDTEFNFVEVVPGQAMPRTTIDKPTYGVGAGTYRNVVDRMTRLGRRLRKIEKSCEEIKARHLEAMRNNDPLAGS